MLILRDKQGRVLLERRPPTGIWGGLWSFPEIDVDNDVESWCRAVGLDRIGEVTEQPILTHTFTHFRLAITPLEFTVDDKGHSIMDSNRWLWYNVSDPARIGLAKPVERLLHVDRI